jgi:hypothetical protein
MHTNILKQYETKRDVLVRDVLVRDVIVRDVLVRYVLVRDVLVRDVLVRPFKHRRPCMGRTHTLITSWFFAICNFEFREWISRSVVPFPYSFEEGHGAEISDK